MPSVIATSFFSVKQHPNVVGEKNQPILLAQQLIISYLNICEFSPKLTFQLLYSTNNFICKKNFIGPLNIKPVTIHSLRIQKEVFIKTISML